MLLSADVHCIKTEYGTWKRRKRNIKLHFHHQNDIVQLIHNYFIAGKKKQSKR